MVFLSLEYIKAHSRICVDCEDSILELYGNAAEEVVANCLNRGKTVGDMVANLVEEYGKIPDSIFHAALMLVDVSYNYRAPISTQNLYIVPYTFDLTIKPYIIL